MPGGGGITERGDLDATPSQPPRAGFRPATRGERARMEGEPPPFPPMNKKEREAEAIAYADALAAALKEKKPEPGRVRSEIELLRAVELIRQRDELVETLQAAHNDLDDNKALYVSNDGSDFDDALKLPGWISQVIRAELYAKIDEIKKALTETYGIPQ